MAKKELTDAQKENLTIVREYLQAYYQKKKTDGRMCSKSTLRTILSILSRYARFRDKSILHMHDDIDAFMCFLAKRTARWRVAYNWMVVDQFREWMQSVGYWRDVAMRSCKHYSMMGTRKTLPKVLLLPGDLFQMRRSTCTLLGALSLELLLSSGMRVGEMIQVRACDIQRGDAPYDVELRSPSPYCAGSIHLIPWGMTLKTRRARTVYYSAVAGRLLDLWVAQRKIPWESELPLFPVEASSIRNCLPQQLGKNQQSLYGSQSTKRLPAFLDVDPDEVEDPWLRKMIEKSHRRFRRQDPILRTAEIHRVQASVEETRNIHPHALRHTFCCLMYYRNYHGVSRDLFQLQSMLGHSKTGLSTTSKYLDSLTYIRQSNEWTRVLGGRTSDWNNVIDHADL